MSEERAGSPDLTGLRVLVVEDDLDTRQLFCTMLRAFNAQARGAASAEEALEILVVFQPDVLVSDIGLPDQDGYDLIHQVRSLPAERGGRIPAIAVTAYGRLEDRGRALRRGFQMHMAKPVDPWDLGDGIARLAAHHRGSKRVA